MVGSNERGAFISGAFTLSFAAVAGGFKLAFPDMIVPFGWALTLIFVGALGLVATLVFVTKAYLLKPKHPDPHRAVLQSLAAPLATVQEQALTYGQRDFGKMMKAKAEAEELISQIPYDGPTVQTVRDFLQACVIVTDTHNTASEMLEARRDVARIGPALFRYLHDGKSINRQKVDLPDWCRREDVARAPTRQEVAKQPPQW